MSIYKMRTELGRYFKWVLLFGVVPIFIIGSIFAFGPGGLGRDDRSKGAEEVVAKVKDIDLTRGEFESAWKTASEQFGQGGGQSLVTMAQYRGFVFQQLVQSKLWLAAAQEEKIDVSDRSVNAEIEKAVTAFLKSDRERVRGKLTKAEAAVDPRDDDAYKSALSKVESSIAARIAYAESMMPREQVRAQLAQQGLIKHINESVKKVTDADVKASYNVFKLTQIAVTGTAKDQLKVKADKLVAEAKGGADFNALAKKNNAGGPWEKAGSQVVYSFETRQSVIPAVREAAEKMKPGDVKSVDLGSAFVVFKLDEVVAKLPEKMDKKTLGARKKAIEEERQSLAMNAFQEKVMKNIKDVNVIDKELDGYWKLSQSMTDPAKSAALRAGAKKAFSAALKENPGNRYVGAQLASMYYEDGEYGKAEIILNGLLNVEHAGESAEMRKMFGDVLVKVNKKDDAIENYKLAGDMARNNNPYVMDELIKVYKSLGQADLAAQMAAQKADYEKRRAAFEAQQKAATPPASPKQ